MSRLPQVNGDKGNWGRILNTWLKHIAGFRGVAPARPASGNLPAGVAINGNGYDTNDQYQSENSGLNFHDNFPAGVPDGFTFIHTVHNRIYRKEGNGWAVLLEGYTPQSGEHLWRRVSTGSPNIRNIPNGFVGVNTDPGWRLHVLENQSDTIAVFEGGANNDIAEVKIYNSNVRSIGRPGGGTVVGGDAKLTFETRYGGTWSVGISADYDNDNHQMNTNNWDNFFVISVNKRFGPYEQNDPSDDYLIITPNNGAVGIGNNHVPNTNLPPSATLPNNGFYKLDVQGNTNVWELTTTQNFRMWGQNPQPNSLLTSTDTQGNAVWRDLATLGLVTNAENIPTNLDGTNSGWPFAQKVGTVLQFRKIVGENQNHGTLFGVRTDGNLIRVGLTGGNNGDIIWRNQNGVYEWTNPSNIRNLLGLGTLTVGTLTASSGVLQVTNPNTFNPANSAVQNINIGFTGGSNGQVLTVNNGTYQWASAQALNLVTDGENIPQSAVSDPNNNGLSYFGKNGTILRFRAIRGENLIRARTENPGDPNTTLIRIGLTGGQGNQPQVIVYNYNNSGTYTWQNVSDIRPLLGLGTLTLNSTTPSNLIITPNTYNPNNNQTINIGLAGDLTQRGSLIAGPNITLSGSTANRLVGSGDVTITANIPNMTDQDWLVAQNDPNGVPNPPIPNNINQWIYTNGRVGIGTSAPTATLHVKGTAYFEGTDSTAPGIFARLVEQGGSGRLYLGKSNLYTGDEVYMGGYGTSMFFASNRPGVLSVSVQDGFLQVDRSLTVKENAYLASVSGRVGIGGVAPEGKVHIKADSNPTTPQLLLEQSSPDGARLSFINNSGSSNYWTLFGRPNANAASALFNLYYSGSGDIISVTGNGNVGIGTTGPHSAAILQLQATDKGFLPTRVALTSAISWSPLVGTPVDGMLVYNTATAGTGQNTVSPGYYYWFAGRWRRLSTYGYEGMIQGVLYSQPQNLTVNWTSWQYLNSYIDLPPGKWIVYSVQLLNPTTVPTSGSVWVRTKFSDHPSNGTTTADYVGNSFYISGLLPNSAKWSLVTGQIIINNTSGTTKRYYYYGSKEPYGGYNADLVNFSTTLWNENQLYALPAD